MLENYLKKAIEDLERLIDLTRLDIEDIKKGEHEAIFNRMGEKESTMRSFETHKSLIDQTIVQRAQSHSDSDLQNVLCGESKELLEQMRNRLEILHEENRRFARLVIAVGEFYDSLFSAMVPTESDGYRKKSAKAASLLEVRV